ncbi:MAG: hypothetical protein IT246_08415 [Bacteroidia bacterium]|nr:hypothetical protein [Bacteroidia bacterium]
MLRQLILIFCGLMFSVSASAQKKFLVGQADKILTIQANYQYILPAGDFAERFHSINALGAAVGVKGTKNLFYSVEGSYHFSNDIQPTNMLNNLATSGGFIIASSGYPTQLNIGMRGFAIAAKAGYILPLSTVNINSGIKFSLGGALVMHKYNINVSEGYVPSLSDEKQKGYDRYSSGFAWNEFIGYQHISRNRYINFYAGVELMQAVTYNRRKFNYDTMQSDTKAHYDFYYGLKFGWIIPVYLRTKNSEDEFIFR